MSENSLVPVEDTTETGLSEIGGGGFTMLPKVSFFGSAAKGERRDRLQAAKVPVHAFYVEDALGIRNPNPFQVIVTPNVFSCWVKRDQKGKTIGAAKAIPGEFARQHGYTDNVLALVLVPLSEYEMTPAWLETTNAVCRLWQDIKRVQEVAVAPSKELFATRGEKHKIAAEALQPWGRMAYKLWTTEDKPKGGQGEPYNVGHASGSPVTEGQVKLLNDFITSGALTVPVALFQKRAQKLRDMIAGKTVAGDDEE